RRHTRSKRDWSSDVCSSDLGEHRELVHAAVKEKNWMWHNDFKIPNGVHVFGRRYDPFGPDNYPAEIQKIREMTDIRDQAIWKARSEERRVGKECRARWTEWG